MDNACLRIKMPQYICTRHFPFLYKILEVIGRSDQPKLICAMTHLCGTSESKPSCSTGTSDVVHGVNHERRPSLSSRISERTVYLAAFQVVAAKTSSSYHDVRLRSFSCSSSKIVANKPFSHFSYLICFTLLFAIFFFCHRETNQIY